MNSKVSKPHFKLASSRLNMQHERPLRWNTIITFLMLVSLSGCGNGEVKHEWPPVEVIILTVEPETIPAIYEYVGFAQSSHEVEIRSSISGTLNSIDFVEGGNVQKDATLFTLDDKYLKAALDSFKAELTKAEAMHWEAKRASERFQNLFDKKAASRRDLDNAIATQLSNEALVESAKAKVRQAEIDLSDATIQAPITGAVGASNYRLGARIIANESLLTTMSTIDPIWVNFSVSEREILQDQDAVKRGELKLPHNNDWKVEIILADGTALPHKGKLDFLSPTYNPETGTMRLRGVIPNPDALLRPGQFVRAKIFGATRPNAIVVPQKAVVQSKKGLYVYILDKEDRAEMRFVTAGNWYNQGWIIKSGLKTGDKVIVEGVNKIQPGSKVKIIEESPS